jgi:hypothetical protein
LKKEWAFLCACASPLRDDKRVKALCASELNWETLLELAEAHGVQGMLARALEKAGYENVSVATREALQLRMRAQHLSTLGLSVELFRVLEDFSKARIEAICVKGPVISQVAHRDPSLRGYGDLDLLVRQRDMPAAYERMQCMGFTPDIPEKALQAEKIPGEYVFRRAGTPRMVELHTEKTFRHYPQPMRIEEMMKRKRTVQLDGRDVAALGLEDEVVFDCVHGGKDFWERLMWVADVAAIVTRHPEIDWKKAWRAAQEVGAERMLHVGMQLANSILGAQVPEGIAHAVQKDVPSGTLCTRIQEWMPYAGHKPPGVVARASYRIQIAGGGIRGVGYLMRLSLSPTEDDWREDADERKSWMWGVLRRPFRLLRKYGSDS